MAKKLKNISLVLDVGGSKGIFHLGIVDYLREHNIKIDAVTGTSVGAINAAAIAANKFDELSDIWESQTIKNNLLSEKKMLGVVGELFKYIFHQDISKFSIINDRKIKEALSKITSDDLINSSIKSAFNYTALDKRKLRTIYSIERNRRIIMQSILASASIPGFFPLVHLENGDFGVDGGIIDPVPVKAIIPLARKSKSEKIIVALCGNSSKGHLKEIKSMTDFALSCFVTYMESLQKINIELGKSKYEWQTRNDIVIVDAIDKDLMFSPFEFDQEKLKRLRKHGYDRAKKILHY